MTLCGTFYVYHLVTIFFGATYTGNRGNAILVAFIAWLLLSFSLLDARRAAQDYRREQQHAERQGDSE